MKQSSLNKKIGLWSFGILIGLLVEENSMFVTRRRLLFGALMEDVL